MTDKNLMPVDDPRAIEQALQVLGDGRLIAFPTDTVYGLAADLTNPQAIDRLFSVKERDTAKAIAVLVGEVEQLDRVSAVFPEAAQILAAHYWPGALTLVVPKRPDLPENLSPYPTVGVRMPDHSFALRLLRASGPLATTSANRSGGANATTAAEVSEQLSDRVDLILDGGSCPGGVPSTVVDCSGSEIRILREGAIPSASIWKVLGQLSSPSS